MLKLNHREQLGKLTQSLWTTTNLTLREIETLYEQKIDRIAKLEHALYNMAYAYVNKDSQSPSSFEQDAIEKTKSLIDAPFLRNE